MEQARDYAFLLLKFRLRSEEEIRQRLNKKKFEAEVIEKAVSFLKEKDFLNDRLFVRAWIKARLQKFLALSLIRRELLLKGVGREIVEAGLRQLLEQGYSEAEAARRIAAQRSERLKGIEPFKARRRLYQYLARRGFSPETIQEAID